MADDEPPVYTPQTALQEIGFVGTRRSGGYILEEFLPELRGVQGNNIFREMGSNDSIIGSMLWVLTLLARQITWQMKPADDSPAAQEQADFFTGCMNDFTGTTWENKLSEIFSFLQYGWSWHEVIAKQRLGMDPPTGADGEPLPASKFKDRRYGWDDWAERSQETWQYWDYDEAGGRGKLRGFFQVNPTDGTGALIPTWKSLHFRTSSARGNPEGKSILRAAYVPWFLKRRMQEYEAIGVERDLVGLPIAWLPAEYMLGTATAEQKATIAQAKTTITKIRRNETDGLVWPLKYDDAGHKLFDFTLATSGGARQFDIGAIITRHDQRMLLAGLADFLLLGHEGVGGLGVTSIGATKVDLLNASMAALVGNVAAEINQKAIPMLCRMNGFPLELAPSWEPGQVKAVDLAVLGKFISDMSVSGVPMWPNDELQQELYRLADLPVPDQATLDAARAAQAPAVPPAAFQENTDARP